MLFKQKINLVAIPKWVPIAILLLALIGFADATYLTVEHFANIIPPCTTGGCEIVLTSKYSQIFGIPYSLLGSVYYLFIAVMSLLYFDTKKEIFLRIPLFVSVVGLIFSLGFVSIMAFVIKALCPYCVVSATTSILIFALSLYSLSKSRYSSQTIQE